MAAGDKLWLELGVRDEVSKVLETLMLNAQKVGNMLTDDANKLKIYYRNINDIAGVYDKIYVAQKRISELKGTSLNADEKKGLFGRKKKVKEEDTTSDNPASDDFMDIPDGAADDIPFGV